MAELIFTTVIDEKDHSEDIESNIISVPDKATKIEVRAKRNDWTGNKETLVWVTVDYSEEGLIWINNFIGFSATDENVYQDAQILEYSDAGRNIPLGAGRKIRVKMKVAETLNTKIEVGFDSWL